MLVLRCDVCIQQIQENIAERFDRYMCSEYTRAMETAALLGMKNAKWICGKSLCSCFNITLFLQYKQATDRELVFVNCFMKSKFCF
jgi:phosphohistidine phosphatase SixA